MAVNLNLNLNIKRRRGTRYPAILDDGNTAAWYDHKIIGTGGVIKDGSNSVSKWEDRLLSGHDLLQAVGADQPSWSVNGVSFPGGSEFMKTATFTLEQPEMIYIVFKQVTWTANQRIFDGYANNTGGLMQANLTPNLTPYTGIIGVLNSNLAVDTFGIGRLLFNGSSSSLQINKTTKTAYNAGAVDMQGFTLGSAASGAATSNIQVKEVIIRKVADGASDEAAIYNYLSSKHGI